MANVYRVKHVGKGTLKEFTNRKEAKAYLGRLLDKCRTFNVEHNFQHPYWIDCVAVFRQYEVETPLSDSTKITMIVDAKSKKEAIDLAVDELVVWGLSKKIPLGLQKKVKVTLLTNR